MARFCSWEYYAQSKNEIKDLSCIRVIAETAWYTGLDQKNPFVTAKKAYKMAIKQPNVIPTNQPISETVWKRPNLPLSRFFKIHFMDFIFPGLIAYILKSSTNECEGSVEFIRVIYTSIELCTNRRMEEIKSYYEH